MPKPNLLEALIEAIATRIAEKIHAAPAPTRTPKKRRKPVRQDKAANVLGYLRGKQGESVGSISKALKVDKTAVARKLSALRDAGAVKMKGRNRGAVWFVTEHRNGVQARA